MQKGIVYFLGLFIMILCISCTNIDKDKPILLEIENQRIEFELNEEFTYSDLIVKVVYASGKSIILDKEEYVVESDSYNKTTEGKYNIKIRCVKYDLEKDYEVTIVNNKKWNEDGTLKILAVGNSYSDDTIEYVWFILKSLGIENVQLGNLYYGGCSIDKHLAFGLSMQEVYEYRKTDNNGKWITRKETTLKYGIEDEDWDYITFQQCSYETGIPSTYKNLDNLISYVNSLKTNPNVEYAFNMTCAYAQTSTHPEFYRYNKDQIEMYNKISSTMKEVIVSNKRIKMIIPWGTSIQNCRTSYIGDNLNRDGHHLTFDLGRYIAGLTFASIISNISVENIDYKPDLVTEMEMKVAIESVINAIKNPFDITESKYK